MVAEMVITQQATLDQLARQAVLEHPNDWPVAERWLSERILADNALFRAIAQPLVLVAVHERVMLHGRQQRAQTVRAAIDTAEALAEAGGDPAALVAQLHCEMETTPWNPDAVKRTPSMLGLLGMGADDQALLDCFTLRRGKALGDAKRPDLNEEIQMRTVQARGIMRPVRWLELLKKRLPDDETCLRDVMDNQTALRLLYQAEHKRKGG